MIQETRTAIGTDWNGIAVVIGAVAAGITGIINAVLNWKAKKTHDVDKTEAIQAREFQTQKITAIAETVDGHASEQVRKIDALAQAVSTQAAGGTVPEQEPGAPGNKLVGIKDGNVTVERAPVRITDPNHPDYKGE